MGVMAGSCLDSLNLVPPTTVTAGEKLRLPAPFDLTLDTSTLPLPA
jgi:hypothetical protein